MSPSAKLATYDDLLALPEDVYAEVIAGELITMPTPYPRHSWTVSAIHNAVARSFDVDQERGGPGGWWILARIDVAFGEHDIVRPDLIGWRRERLSDFWDTRPITVVPDWICEVTETPFVSRDRVTKANLYLKHGVSHYWLADPEGRTLTALERKDARWTRVGAYGDRDHARLPPFAEVEIEIGMLFPPDMPSDEKR